jgi:aminopeptidase N
VIETKRFVFKENSMTIDLPEKTTSYKFNLDQSGFYRIKYEKDNLLALGKLVKRKILSTRDRFGLQNDLYAFVRSMDYSIDDYLDFMEYYTEEEEFLPLVTMSANLVHAFKVIETRRERISAIGFKIFYRVLELIGYEPKEGESHKVTNLRSSLLGASYLFNDEGVAAFGRKKFQEYLDGEKVHPDILAITMRIGAAQSPESYPVLTEKLESGNTPEPEQLNILGALGSIEDKEILLKVLDYAIEKVPSRNRMFPIIIASQNLVIFDELWDWFLKNINELEKLHPMHYESVIGNVVSRSGLDRVEEVKSFFEDYMNKKDKAKDTIKMTLERLEINARLRNS